VGTNLVWHKDPSEVAGKYSDKDPTHSIMTDRHGRVYFVRDIIDQNADTPTKQFSPAMLRKIRQSMGEQMWLDDNFSNRVSPLQVLSDLDNQNYSKHKDRINNADLSYPVLLSQKNTGIQIIDGAHRLAKHLKEQEEGLPASLVYRQIKQRQLKPALIASAKYKNRGSPTMDVMRAIWALQDAEKKTANVSFNATLRRVAAMKKEAAFKLPLPSFKSIWSGFKSLPSKAWGLTQPYKGAPFNASDAIKKRLLNESAGQHMWDSSGNTVSGMFSGISQGGFGAAMRGVGGYYLGDSLDGDYSNKGGINVPFFGRLSNAGLAAGAAAAGLSPIANQLLKGKLLSGAVKNTVWSNPAVVNNVFGQPVMRAASLAALGDYADTAGNLAGLDPSWTKYLKWGLMGVGGALGSRPLIQSLATTYPSLAKSLYNAPRMIPALLNNTKLTGAPFARSRFFPHLITRAPAILAAPFINQQAKNYRNAYDQMQDPDIQRYVREGMAQDALKQQQQQQPHQQQTLSQNIGQSVYPNGTPVPSIP
jgi:hypothetical protein